MTNNTILIIQYARVKRPARNRVFKKISKVETPTHDNIRELVTWEGKEHGVKSYMC